MKTALHFKFSTFLLGFIILLQSCTVYHSSTTDISDAVKSHNKVKMVSNSNSTYKFKKIIEKDDLYFGIANANSSSAIKYSGNENIELYSKNLYAYPLDLQNIKEIYTKNRELSTILSIGIPILIVTTTLIIIAQSLDFGFGEFDGL